MLNFATWMSVPIVWAIFPGVVYTHEFHFEKTFPKPRLHFKQIRISSLTEGKSRTYCWTLSPCNSVYGTMSRAELPLNWSVIHYQVIFE